MELDIDAALEALADPLRRIIFERIVIRPRRVVDLTEGLGVTRPAVSYHVKVLREAAMIEEVGARLTVRADVLPTLRVYFDRLWLEASLGDAWLNQRRIRSDDLGL